MKNSLQMAQRRKSHDPNGIMNLTMKAGGSSMAQAAEMDETRRMTTLGDEPTAIGKYSNQSAFLNTLQNDSK